MTIFHAFILAIIEGLTEFLPVSSTGHIIIGSSIMGIASDPFTKLFTVCIQFGAILSVVIIYWKKFIPSANLQTTISFYKRLIIAFIPAVIAGFFFKKYIDALLENVIVVGISLFVGGVIFLLLDKWFAAAEERGENELKSNKKAFLIGLFQVIAMIPGVSRSAATIIGGLTQRLNKKELDQHLWLPHAGGRREPGARARIHAGRRQGVREDGVDQGPGGRRLCAAAFVLLGDRDELLSRDCQDACCAPAVVPDHAGLQCAEPEEPDAANALPDQRLEPDRAGPLQQHRPHHGRGHGRGLRRHAKPAHQQLRRGDCTADRVLGPHRAQHPADPAGRDAHPARRRPLGRQLPDGDADAGHGRRGLEDHRRSRCIGRHDEGGRQRLGQAEDRGQRGREAGPHRRRTRRDRRRQRVPQRRPRPDGSSRHRQPRSARRPDRAAGGVACIARCRQGAIRARRADAMCRNRRGQLARSEYPGGAPAGYSRRSQRCAGKSLGAPPRRHAEGDRGVRSRLRQCRGLGPAQGRDCGLCHAAGPAPARPDRQARPGRTRPRRQGGGQRLRRPRFRRRHRPAVPDRRGVRQTGDRERRPRRRRLHARRGPQDLGARDPPGPPGPRRRRHRRLRRRCDPAPGLSNAL